MLHFPKQRSAGIILALLLFLAGVAACIRRPPTLSISPPAYTQEIEQWHQQRWQELSGESGWLTLVGLFWLKPGDNICGSDFKMDIVLTNQKLPAKLGNFSVGNDGRISEKESLEGVWFEPLAEGFTVEGKPLSVSPRQNRNVVQMLQLTTDAAEKPTILNYGSLSFQIIQRGDKLGLRVKDSQNPDRLNFKGTDFYPTDVRWRIDAHFEAYHPPKPMPITNVLGMENSESSPGAVKFLIDGKEYRLDAITEKNEPRLFMIIADKTSGKDTYPAGRYLYIDPPDGSGHVTIDFNKAYSPPCAFTKFATCPLPPRQNRLPIAIEAGEKYQRHDDTKN